MVIHTPSPTLAPTLPPTPAPTDAPTAEPTAAPTAEPTAAPTAAPTASPTLSPTPAPTPNPTNAPTPGPTHLRGSAAPTLSPTPFPTIAKANVNIKKRVDQIFKKHENFLIDSEIQETIESFLEIEHPNKSELKIFKNAINAFKDGLGTDNVWLFLNIDNLLTSVENEYKLEQVGLTELSENFHTESPDGINHFVTVSSALGSKNISSIIHDGSKDITGIIGNHTLAGITLVNITYNKPGSISAAFTSLKTSISNALGYLIPLHLKDTIIISACDNENANIVSQIYNISTTPTLADTINGFVACNSWVHNFPNYHITNTDESGCIEVLGMSKALTKCMSYLTINDEL